MRQFAFLLLLCACSSLSTEQRDQLVACQRNAGLYFDGGRLDQAMTQIERGLELAPDDYKLNALKGAILLRTSASASGTDHRRLDEATALLQRMFEERSPNRHEPYLLTNYALALQKQGLRHLGEAVRCEGQASRAVAVEASALSERATTEREQATGKLSQAFELFGVLIERGEVLRVARNHRTQIARQLGDDKAFVAEATAYAEQAAKDEAWLANEIERTTTAAYEAQQLETLRQVRAEELEVRSLLAEFHYGKGQNDPSQFRAALLQLNRVLELDPQRSVDYYNRGRVLLELKRDDEAKADFRRFLVDPSLPATNEKVVFAARALDR